MVNTYWYVELKLSWKRRLYEWLAYHLLPPGLVKQCAIKVFAHATTHEPFLTRTPDQVNLWEALESWDSSYHTP